MTNGNILADLKTLRHKIILTSKGVNSKKGRIVIRRALKECLGAGFEPLLADKTMVICTAAEDEAGDLLTAGAEELGFQKSNIVIWDEHVDGKYLKDGTLFDFCYVSEGNTFEIAKMLQLTGGADMIRRCMEAGACYIGASAGAALSGDIGLAGEFDKNYARIRRDMFDGLNILPPSLGKTALLPHMTKVMFERWRKSKAAYLLEDYDTILHIPNTRYYIFDAKRDIFESHAHLDLYDTKILDSVLAASAAAGVSHIVVPPIRFESNFRMKELFDTDKYRGRIFLTVGVHPKEAVNLSFSRENKQKLEELMDEGYIVALKTGLDCSNTKLTPGQIQNQVKWFRYFVLEAAKRGLPLILHVRDAMELFEEEWQKCRDEAQRINGTGYEVPEGLTLPEAVLHCYNGQGAAQTEKLRNMGIHYFGIGGKITQGDSSLEEAVEYLPLDSLLLETDSPFVCPAEYEMPRFLASFQKKAGSRRKINMPSSLPGIAARIAEIKQLETEELIRITGENARRFYEI